MPLASYKKFSLFLNYAQYLHGLCGGFDILCIVVNEFPKILSAEFSVWIPLSYGHTATLSSSLFASFMHWECSPNSTMVLNYMFRC